MFRIHFPVVLSRFILMKPFLQFIFLSLTLMIFCFGANAQLRSHQFLSSEEAQEDFQILWTTLKEVHPDLYRLNSKIKMDSLAEEMNQDLAKSSSVGYLELLSKIAELTTAVGDIHLQWSHSRDYIKFRNQNIPVIPLVFEYWDGSFLLKDDFGQNLQLQLGTKIIAINGEKMDDYLVKNYPLLPIQGENHNIQAEWLANYYPNHHTNFWEQPSFYILESQYQNETIRTDTIWARTKGEFLTSRQEESTNTSPYQFKIEGQKAFLKIEYFKKKYFNEEHPGMDLAEFGSYLDSVFQIIHQEKIELLELDIQGFNVGDHRYGQLLFAHLVDQPFQYVEEVKLPQFDQLSEEKYVQVLKTTPDSILRPLSAEHPPAIYPFSGQLDVYANGISFSAKSLFCSNLVKRAQTTFKKACGAAYYGINCGELAVNLPHSGIKVYIPTKQLICNPEFYSKTEGILYK